MAVKGKEPKGKGKQLAGKGSSRKRKLDDTDKSGARKRKNRGVLQFFDVAAEVEDEDEQSEDDGYDDDDFLDEIDAELKDKKEAGKSCHLPFIPKEEELSDDDEIAELLQERYRRGSRHVFNAEDDYEAKNSVDGNGLMPSKEDPTIYRVKCMVGRERHSVFCLMQKYVDLQSLGNKLQTVSAFALEHVKGHIFVEAYREFDVIEACKGLCSIYSSRLTRVPTNECSHLLSTRGKISEVSVGSWARMKYGNYRGDLAQVVAVNAARKRATVKLIPRIDLQAIAKKLSGGGSIKQAAIPAPRLISSSELEDLRKHIQCRRDRESGLFVEIIDGLMLKDGYLYKRVSIESLSFCGVVPSAEELQRFEASKEQQSDDVEWLSGLYGGRGRKYIMESDKGKHSVFEDTSETKQGSGFEVHNLVFFGENDVGVITGMEDGDRFQILKDDEGGSETVIVELDELRIGSDDTKSTPVDHHKKKISINDAVRVLEGPFKDRQGIVKQMYRGTLFIFDESQLESGGYFCTKSQFCEKFKHSKDASQEIVDDGPGPPGFQDSMASFESPPSSPKSSPSKGPGVARGNFRDSNSNCQGDRDGIFSIGQTVRIRVGPLKGYLCRVIAIYRSDVTVKLDCQLKVIKVKCEHLSEVRVKTSGESYRDPDSNTEFGSQGWPKDLMDGKGAFGESNGWNSSGLSTGRNSWPDFSPSGILMKSPSVNPFGSTADALKKDEGDDAWGSKLVSATGNKTKDSWGMAIGSSEDQNSTWDKVETKNKGMDPINDNGGTWGGSADCWDNATAKDSFCSSKSDGWNKAKFLTEEQAGSSRDAGFSWDTAKSNSACWNKAKNVTEAEGVIQKTSDDLWHKGEVSRENRSSGWNSNAIKIDQPNSWDKGKLIDGNDDTRVSPLASQGKPNADDANQSDSWGKAADVWKGKGVTTESKTHWSSATGGGGWGNAAGCSMVKVDQGSGWNKDKGWSATKPEKWGNMKENREGEPTGWRKSGDCNTADVRQIQPASWDEGKSVDESEGAWRRAGDHEGKANADKGNFNDSWAKAYETGKAKDGSSRNKTDCWNSATAAACWSASKSDNFGGNKGGWNKPWAGSEGAAVNTEDDTDGGKKDQNSSWSGARNFENDRGFGWNKGMVENKEGWGNREQEGGWDKRKTFDRGQGSGGRRGRGRGRGSDNFNRDRSFGRNDEGSNWNTASGGNQTRWNDGSNASEGGGVGGWNNSKVSSDNQHGSWKSGTSDGDGNQAYGRGRGSNWNMTNASNENQSGWQKGSSDAGGSQTGWDKSNWNTSKASTEKQSGWNQGNGGTEAGGHGRGGDNFRSSNWNTASGGNQTRWNDGSNASEGGVVGGWNNSKVSSDNQHTSWKSGTSDGNGNQAYGRGRGSNRNMANASNENQPGWQKGSSDAGGSQTGWDKSNWNTPKASTENQSGWNQGSAGIEAGGQKDQGDCRDKWKTSGGKSDGDVGGDHGTGWKSGNASGGDKWAHSSKGSDDQSSSWNRKTFENRDSVGDWGVKSFSGASGWSGGQTSENQVGDPKSSSDQPRGFRGGHSSGPTRGGFDNRGRGRGNQFSGRGRGRGFGEEGSYKGNRNDSDGGWENSNRGDGWNQGGSGNRGRGRREQPGGRGGGRSSSEEDSLHWNQKNSDDFGGHAGSWNQGSAAKGQWQSSSVGNSGWSKNAVGSTSEAGGASSLDKGKDENPWGNTAGSWGGASPSGNRKDENQWSSVAGSWGTGSSGKGKDESQWVNAAASCGPGSSGKGKDESQLGNAAGSWGTSSLGKGKDTWGDAGDSWSKGSDGKGPKSGW